ncbi:MAG: hypothetical protein HY816_22880 [Candidatus Wallbacteria bacterium]|nr:hypothetical protein [Candidatus Wallbacteria bacterium]
MSIVRARPWAYALLLSSLSLSASAYDAIDSDPQADRWQRSEGAPVARSYARRAAQPAEADDIAEGSDFDSRDAGVEAAWPAAGRSRGTPAKAVARQPVSSRWRAGELSEREARGAYATRPDGSRDTRSSRKFSQASGASAPDASYRSRSRIDSDFGAKGEVPAPTADSVRRVWSSENGARVKTVYDDNGNVVYRKGWSEKTGEEVPIGGGAGSVSGTMPRGKRSTSKGKKDLVREDAEQVADADRREREDLRGLRQPPREENGQDGPHHLRHRHVVRRDGPSGFSIAIPVWYNTLTGNVSGPTGTGTGAITSDNNTKAGLEMAIPHWGASYLPIRHSTTLAGAFTFEGTAYAAGAALQFDVDMYDLWTRWGLLDWHIFHLDWMLGSKVMDPTIAVTGGGATTSFTELFPIPYLGLVGHWEINQDILIKGMLKYSDLSLDAAQETMTEAEIALAYEWGSDFEFSKRNQVSVGYRLMALDVIDNAKSATTRSQADAELRGVFAKLTAYF